MKILAVTFSLSSREKHEVVKLLKKGGECRSEAHYCSINKKEGEGGEKGKKPNKFLVCISIR